MGEGGGMIWGGVCELSEGVRKGEGGGMIWGGVCQAIT